MRRGGVLLVVSTAQVSAVEHHADTDQYHRERQVTPDETCLAGEDDDGETDKDRAYPPPDLAGTQPARHDRVGFALTGDQQPARHVQQGTQPACEAEQDEGNPEDPYRNSETPAHTGRYPRQPAALVRTVK